MIMKTKTMNIIRKSSLPFTEELMRIATYCKA